MQPRPVDDLADAQQRAARERRDADAMTRERLAQENRQRGNGLAGFTPPQAAASAPQPRAKAAEKIAEPTNSQHTMALVLAVRNTLSLSMVKLNWR